MINKELLEKLICINCHKPCFCEVQEGLICSFCKRRVSIYNGVPKFVSDWELKRLKLDENPYVYESHISQINQTQPWRLHRIDKPLLRYIHGDVLEIGCGTCRLAKFAEERGGRYFGIDPQLSFLKYAYHRYKLSRLVCGIGEKLPFLDGSFDCIISGYYGYSSVNIGLGFSESRRVLKKNGKFVFGLLNYRILKLMTLKKSLKLLSLKKFLQCFLEPKPSELSVFVKLSHLEQRAEEAGFKVENMVSSPVTPLFPILNKYLSNFYFKGRRTIYLGLDVIVTLSKI